MVTYVRGDLLTSDCDYICHQVNCQGVMSAGIARQIRERWPNVYRSYKKFYEDAIWDNSKLLGRILIVPLIDDRRRIVNMFTQNDFGFDGKRYTSYDAFAMALDMITHLVPKGFTIAFPKNIGCGLGGGNWKIISTMIEEILGDKYEVYIYEL